MIEIHRLLLLLVIIFMQGIYSYINETNHVSRLYSVEDVLCLLSVLYVTLFHM